MDLQDFRKEIDVIDDELVSLFIQRMEVAARIGAYKKEHGLPIHVPQREAEKLAELVRNAGEPMGNYVQALYTTIFQLSRSYQQARQNPAHDPSHEVAK